MAYIGKDKTHWDNVPDKEIDYCRKCDKKIWIYWKRGDEPVYKCGNCYFKRK